MDWKLTSIIAYLSPILINFASYELLDHKMFVACWIEHLVHSVEERCELVIASMLHIKVLLLRDGPVIPFEQTSELKADAVFDLNQLLYQIVIIGNREIQLLKRNAELAQTSNIILVADFDQTFELLGVLVIDEAKEFFKQGL